VGYINAHGTSTKLNDTMETAAVKRVFGEHAKEVQLSSINENTNLSFLGTGSCSDGCHLFQSIVTVLKAELTKLTADSQTMSLVKNEILKRDYLNNRLNILESKVKTFHHVEALLSLEKEKIEMEKREFLIQKYYNPNNQNSAQIGNSGLSGSQTVQANLSIPYNNSFTSLPNFR